MPALLGVKEVQVLQQSVTSLTLVNNTAKTVDVSVAAGMEWQLLALKLGNPDDVQRTVSIIKYKEAAKTNALARLEQVNANAGVITQWPGGSASTTSRRNPTLPWEKLEAGNTLSFIWATGGASAGGTDADGIILVYEESFT